MKTHKHILNRLLDRSRKASSIHEAELMLGVHKELDEKYFANDLTYKEIFDFISQNLDYNLSDSDGYKKFYWKLTTLNELFASKCGIINNEIK